MIYLMLAILSSAAISFILRCFDKKINNNMVMFMGNYMICVILSGIFTGRSGAFHVMEGTGFAAIIGAISGVFYLMGFVLLQLNIRKNGMLLSGLFMRLGIIVPLFISLVFFREVPTIIQIIGIVLAIVAIVIINLEKKEDTAIGHVAILLILLLVVGGLTDSFANIHDKLGNRDCSDQYLLITFAMALICSIIMIFVKKQSFTVTDFAIGMFVGIPNYFCSRFLLASLSKLQSIVVYPVYNIGTILLISLCGIIVFKEKLSKNKIIGLILVMAALILLNI